MAFLWLFIRIILLGYERIAGKKISEGNDTLISSWGFFTFSFLTMIPFITGLNFEILKISLISGFIYSLSFYLYVKALSSEDASVIAPLYNINVIFLIFLTWFFLGEKITTAKILGSLIMIYGISYLKKENSLKKSFKNIFKSKGAVSMIVSSLLLGLGRTVDGYFVKSTDELTYSVAIYMIVSINFTVISIIKYKSLKPHINIVKNKIFSLLTGGFSNAYSYVALLKAFKYVDVSVAEPVSMLSAVITSLMAKFIFREKIAIRLLGTFILILGAFIIYI